MNSRLLFSTMSASMMVALTACGGGKIVTTCDEPQNYQSAQLGAKVRAPEGLDELDELKEMPIPEPTPRPPRPPGSRCIELPPVVVGEQQ